MSDGSDYYKYLQPTTEVVAYAWNAEMVCVPCVRKAITEILISYEADASALADRSLEDMLADYAFVELGVTRDRIPDLDTSEFPSPATAGEEGIMEDSCGRCLARIEDTL